MADDSKSNNIILAILGLVFLVAMETKVTGGVVQPLHMNRRASIARQAEPLMKGPMCMRPGEVCEESALLEYSVDMPCCIGQCIKTVVGEERTAWRCA